MENVSVNGAGSIISGGDITNGVGANFSGSVQIRGGRISGSLRLTGTSSIVLSGSGFNFPAGAVAPLTGRLVGTLADGNQIDMPFERQSTASLSLMSTQILD